MFSTPVWIVASNISAIWESKIQNRASYLFSTTFYKPRLAFIALSFQGVPTANAVEIPRHLWLSSYVSVELQKQILSYYVLYYPLYSELRYRLRPAILTHLSLSSLVEKIIYLLSNTDT